MIWIDGVELLCGFMDVIAHPVEYWVRAQAADKVQRFGVLQFLVEPIVFLKVLRLAIKHKLLALEHTEVWRLATPHFRFSESFRTQTMFSQIVLSELFGGIHIC